MSNTKVKLAENTKTELMALKTEFIVVCPRCNGSMNVSCPLCGGVGQVDNEHCYTTCPLCDGGGRRTCPTCGGTGQAYEEVVDRQILKIPECV